MFDKPTKNGLQFEPYFGPFKKLGIDIVVPFNNNIFYATEINE